MKLSYSLLHFIMSYSKVYYSVLSRIYNGQWCVEIYVDWIVAWQRRHVHLCQVYNRRMECLKPQL